MAARIISIADDVVTVINGGVYTINDTIDAKRLYVPEFSVEDLKTLKISVIPVSIPEEISARGRTQLDFMVMIGVQKKTSNLLSEFDKLVEFMEEMNALFRFNQLPVTGVSWIASENDPVYDPDYATNIGVFTSVLSLTFRDFLKAS